MQLLLLLIQWIIARSREGSTWAGLSAIGILFGLPPGTVDSFQAIATGVAGLAAIVLKDKAPAVQVVDAKPVPVDRGG